LKGFAKVALEPGERKTVTILLDPRAFAYYDPAYGRWVAEPGQFDILVGASSADIRCCATVTLASTVRLPSILNEESTIRAWFNDPAGRPILQPIFDELMKKGGFFGEDGMGDNAMDVVSFLMDLPLRSFFDFQEHSLTQPASDITNQLLEQVRAVSN
jgi:beta-glucosidase